jgi:hypothetical protein
MLIIPSFIIGRISPTDSLKINWIILSKSYFDKT